MRISVSLLFLITCTLATVPPWGPAQGSIEGQEDSPADLEGPRVTLPRDTFQPVLLVERRPGRPETIPIVAVLGEDAIIAHAAAYANERAAEEASNLGPGVGRDIYDRCYEELYRKLGEVYTPINGEQAYSAEELFHPARLMLTELPRLVSWMNDQLRHGEFLADEAAQEYINSRVISHRNILSEHDT